MCVCLSACVRVCVQKQCAPTQRKDGEWNCSAEDWTTFRPHVACNLWEQCLDGRDEDGCPHTRCAQGGFEVSGQCYLLQR